jgi:hypothetical protein
MNLTDIQAVLEEDFETLFYPASEEIPMDQLLVALEHPQTDQEPYMLELLYIPGVQAELDDVKLLQFFLALDNVTPSARVEARHLLTHINQQLPLVGFNLHEAGNYFYFRHVLVMPEESRGYQDGVVVSETVWLIYYLLHNFQASLSAVAQGQQTVASLLTPSA